MSFEGTPRPCPNSAHCFLASPSLPSWISNSSNVPFRTQRKSLRLNRKASCAQEPLHGPAWFHFCGFAHLPEPSREGSQRPRSGLEGNQIHWVTPHPGRRAFTPQAVRGLRAVQRGQVPTEGLSLEPPPLSQPQDSLPRGLREAGLIPFLSRFLGHICCWRRWESCVFRTQFC